MKRIPYIVGMLLLIAASVPAQNLSKSKYVNHTEFGGLFGRVKYVDFNNGSQEQVDNRLSLTLQMFNGVQLHRRLAAGVTVGMDWYKAALLNPVAAGIRYDLTSGGNVRLYATADAGYAFAWFHDDPEGLNTKGGLMINPGLGLKIGKPGAVAVTLALSYKRQEARVTKVPLWDQKERYEDRVYNRMALRLGFTF